MVLKVLNEEKPLALGIDVGGTNIKAGLVDVWGKVVAVKVIPTYKEKGWEYIVNQLEKIISTLKKSTTQKIKGVGLALPGAVDDRRGYCLYCPNLGWGELEISKGLAERTRLPVRIVNDANAACLGEYYYGGGQGIKTFLSITLGTGVGSGLILNGCLFNGFSGSGMEAGHMVVNPDGFQCTCGRRGCWETLVSAPGIIRRTTEKMKVIKGSNLEKFTTGNFMGNNRLTTEKIFQACREKDQLAQAVVEETNIYMAVGIANLVNLFNPSMVSLGGGVAEAEEISISSLIKLVNNSIFPTLKGKVEIYKSTQGYYGGVVGAASLWLQDVSEI